MNFSIKYFAWKIPSSVFIITDYIHFVIYLTVNRIPQCRIILSYSKTIYSFIYQMLYSNDS